MADEVQVQFVVPGLPQTVQAAWRSAPPEPFSGGGFRLSDESYESLTFEHRYYDWPQKLMFVVSLGFALLFKGFMGSYFRLTARFDAEGTTRTRITVVGNAHPRTRRELAGLATRNGGPVGLRVGV